MAGGSPRGPAGRSHPARSNPRPAWLRWLAPAALVALALVLWRRIPGGFFAPDDLIVLERIRGLRPLLAFPWRWLSLTAYPAIGSAVLGLEPVGWMAVQVLLHAGSVALLFAWARALGLGAPAATLAAGLLAASPMAFYPLQQIASAGEFMALGLTLGALLALGRGGAGRLVLGTALFAAAVLSKESVALLPLVLLLPAPGSGTAADGWRRALPLLAVAAAIVAYVAVGPSHAMFGGGAYATRLGAHAATNLLLYASWIADLASVSPGAVNTIATGSAIAGGLVLAALLAAAVLTWRSRRPGAIGAAWFLLALVPVLPLVSQVQAHYVYVPLAGAALAFAAAADLAFERLAPRGPAAWVVTILLLAALAIRTDALAARRYGTLLGGADLPVDPWLRKSAAARNLVGDVGRGLGGRAARVVLFLPPEMMRAYSARSSSALTADEVARMPQYLLARQVSDDGRALRLFHPNITSVAWTAGWHDSLAAGAWFLVEGGSHATPLGSGLAAQARFAGFANAAGQYAMARRHLEQVFAAGAGDARTHFEYGRALAGLGDVAGARRELERVLALMPDAGTANLAREGLLQLGERPR